MSRCVSRSGSPAGPNQESSSARTRAGRWPLPPLTRGPVARGCGQPGQALLVAGLGDNGINVRLLVAADAVIASAATQSRASVSARDCFVAALLAMTAGQRH